MSPELWRECAAVGLLLVAALIPFWPLRFLGVRALRIAGRLGERRSALVAIVLGALTALLTAAHAKVVHWPEPSIHDEFAYLLSAETFAGGELARPPLGLAEHFDTYHVLQEPSYAPKYPPGQGLFLGAGLALTGEVRAGLWLQLGCMVAAFTWMLLAWLPSRWAVVTALLAAAQLAVATPWSQTFFGGGVAALGGALTLGAAGRVMGPRRTDPIHWTAGAALGGGLGIMALSRPFEGAVVGAICCLFVAQRLLAEDWRKGLRLGALAAPWLLGAGALLAAHNHAVTGSALRLPYMEYDAQASVYPAFLWADVSEPPTYTAPELEAFHLSFQAGDYYLAESLGSFLPLVLGRGSQILRGLLGMLLTVVLIGLLSRGARRHLGLPIALCVAAFAAASVTVFSAAHYVAPAAGALYVLAGAGLRSLARMPLFRRASPAVLAAAVAIGVLGIAGARASKRYLGGERNFGFVRAGIIQQLEASPGDDLVLVRRTPRSSVHHEFVFNGADLEAASIVWARDLGEGRHDALLARFEGRKLWRLTVGSVDQGELKLTPLGPDGRPADD